MSEEIFSVFSPLALLSDNMSRLRTKRSLINTPTRNCTQRNISSTPTNKLTDFKSPNSGFREQSPGKVIADFDCRRKILKSSSIRSQKALNFPSTPTPPKRTSNDPMISTPLSSFTKNPPVNFRRARLRTSDDLENIPPSKGRPDQSHINFQSKLNILRNNVKNSDNVVLKTSDYHIDLILSPKSQFKRLNPKHQTKFEEEIEDDEAPFKKMKSETRMRLFESCMAEADDFESTNIRDGICDEMRLKMDEDFNRNFCSQLNYTNFETTKSRTEASLSSPSSSSYKSGLGFLESDSETSIVSRDQDSQDSSLAKIEEHYLLEESSGSSLPLIKGRREDCNSISPETLRNVIEGDYDDALDDYIIIDCRYPYEYEGGHVKDAINLYTREGISDKFMKENCRTRHRSAIIFHCEFSSERGPRLMQHLRNIDRQANLETYPSLYYPELYLLDGGYKFFFESYPKHCEPQLYKPMAHKDHIHELRHFRAKAKSWVSSERKGEPSKPSKRKGIKASRRRCLMGDSQMEVDENEVNLQGKTSATPRLKKSPRTLFLSYHSEASCQDSLESFEFQMDD